MGTGIRGVFLSALLALTFVSVSTAAEVVDTGLMQPPGISAYGGVAAWTAWNEAGASLTLMRGGKVVRTGLPMWGTLDVGPDAHGRPVVVYVHGRRIYSLDPASGRRKLLYRNRKPGTLIRAPTIWKSRLAFFSSQTDERFRMNVMDLRTHRVRSRPGGGGSLSRGIGQPGDADLRGGRLLFSWSYLSGCTKNVPGDGDKDPEFSTSELAELSIKRWRRERKAAACNREFSSVSALSSGAEWIDTMMYGPERGTGLLRTPAADFIAANTYPEIAFDGAYYFAARDDKTGNTTWDVLVAADFGDAGFSRAPAL